MVKHFTGDVASALLSSSAYTALFYPLHRVKVLLQTQHGNPEIQSGRLARFTLASSFPRLIKENGLRSLWRGCTPYMLRHVPSTTLSFALKDSLARAMPAYDPATQQIQFTLSRLAAGGVAGVAALAIVYPLDLTTIRMAAHLGPKDPGMLETIQGSTRRGGLMALYRGFGISALAIGGYKALYFGLYDLAKTYILNPAAAQAAPHSTQAFQPALAHSCTTHGHAGPSEQHHEGSHPHHDQHTASQCSTLGGRTATSPSQSAQQVHHDPASWAPVQALQADSGVSTPLPSSHTAPAPAAMLQHPHSHTLSLASLLPRHKPPLHASHAQTNTQTAPGDRHVSPPPGPSSHGLKHLLHSWLVASGVVWVATTITYPLDVLRKRWVVDAGLPDKKYQNAWQCARGMLKQEGLRGFYRFYTADMVLRFGGGILLVAYDEIRSGLWHWSS